MLWNLSCHLSPGIIFSTPKRGHVVIYLIQYRFGCVCGASVAVRGHCSGEERRQLDDATQRYLFTVILLSASTAVYCCLLLSTAVSTGTICIIIVEQQRRQRDC